jgi:hypothetical protein
MADVRPTVGGILAKFRGCGCSDPRRPLAQEIVRLMIENDALKAHLALVADTLPMAQAQ